MSEPFHALDRTATEHSEFRREIEGLLAWLASDTASVSDLAARIDHLRRRLLSHFEHEELSWSARAEELDSADFCTWTASFTAQHRDFDARLSSIVDQCAAARDASDRGLRTRLEALFRELAEHERGESHLLARRGGGEDEAQFEP